MHPKDPIYNSLKQDAVYKWTCPVENCNAMYIGQSSRCLEGDQIHISLHSLKTNHPVADISHFCVISRDGNYIVSETKEAIHISKHNPLQNRNDGEVYIPQKIVILAKTTIIFNSFKFKSDAQ